MKPHLLTLAVICLLTGLISPASEQERKATATPHRQVAITFDDLPGVTYGHNLETLTDITKRLLQVITSNKIPAIGFVNEQKLYQEGEVKARVALLKMWLYAGLELGNHTFSHPSPHRISLDAYQEDVIRGEAVTRKLLQGRGMKLRYFRHPQLQTGPSVEYKEGLERFLAKRGYTIAPVTIDNTDYVFAAVYARANARGDRETMKRVGEAYVPYMERMFEFFEKLSVDFLGREVRQILLLHSNALNAEYFDDLVNMMKRRGYTFISLERALEDEAYRLPDVQTTRGLSWIQRWMMAKGLPLNEEPAEPEFVRHLFNAGRQ